MSDQLLPPVAGASGGVAARKKVEEVSLKASSAERRLEDTKQETEDRGVTRDLRGLRRGVTWGAGSV